jgi:hypothetical protein
MPPGGVTQALTPDLILGRTYRASQEVNENLTRPQYSPNNRLGNLSDELKLLQNQLIRNNNHLIHHTSGYLQTP